MLLLYVLTVKVLLIIFLRFDFRMHLSTGNHMLKMSEVLLKCEAAETSHDSP